MDELDPQAVALDPEILEAALEDAEGGEPGLDALHDRFPDRPDAVRVVLRALRSYSDLVRLERSSLSAQDHDDLLEAGTLLGDYRIGALIGSGGMGVVYRATQLSEARQVAIKVLRPEFVRPDRRSLDRFHREAELLAGVVHPNLARTLGSCVEGDRVYFAMELVNGRTLGEVLQRLAMVRNLGSDRHEHPGYIRRVVLLVSKVARGLAAIHERGLIHRDVKPSNIILRGADEDDQQALAREPVLVDNGLLRPAVESDLTSSQTLLGTPAFVSPEARLGRKVDARSDVFSLGVVLYDLLTLTAPGKRRIASSGLHDIAKVNPAVDQRLSAIVARSMEDRPGLRYADGAAFERELTRYVEGKSIRALPRNPVGRLWQSARHRPAQTAVRGSMLAVALTGLVVLVAGEVRRARTLRSLVQFEQTGQLYRAWQSWNALPTQGGLLSAILGTDRDLVWAESYWGGEFGLVCSQLDPARDQPEEGHESLREFLLSAEEAEHFEAVLRFLARELKGDDPWRALSAAKTVAIYFMIRPRAWGESLPDEELDERLEGALCRLVTSQEDDASLRRTRYYAVASLSGLPRTASFETLIPLLANDDTELRRLAVAGLLRQCYLAWQDFQEGEIPVSLLDRWLTTLADSAQEHKESVFLGGAYQNSLHAIVDTYLAMEQSPTRALIPGHPRLAEYLEDLEMKHKEADNDGDPTVDRWREFECDNANFRIVDRRRGTVGRTSPWEGYENPWSRDPTEGELPPLPPDRGARVFSFSLTDVSGPAYVANADHSPMKSVRWKGAVLQETKIEAGKKVAGQFQLGDTRGPSQVTFTCPIPESTGSAEVTITHEKSARWFMPYRGETVIEIRVLDEDSVQKAVSFEESKQRLTIHKQILESFDDLVITIQFVSGTTEYWLREVVVKFN